MVHTLIIVVNREWDLQPVGNPYSESIRLREPYKKTDQELCKIIQHFINDCERTWTTWYLLFILIDALNNVGDLNGEAIDNMILKKTLLYWHA